MATEVKIPTLGESISSGILAAWHVKDGDVVKKGQALFDLETDKITSEGTAEVAGRISLKVAEGDEVEIGAVVAEIDESAAEEAAKSDPSDRSKKSNQSIESNQSIQSKESTQASASPEIPPRPSVQRLAAESGIDPTSVSGTGKGGRVTKEDMTAAIAAKKNGTPAAEPAPAPAPAAAPTSGERQTRRKMTPLRQRIAERLVEAQRTAAILTTFNEVDMKPVMDLRKKHQDAFVAAHGVKLGFMSFFTKAVVAGLKAVPALNAQIDGNFVVENHYYDIGVAVSTPRGLMVPVIRNCDRLSFAEIETEIIRYANKAKEGKIAIDDLEGGVFTITNGGIFGSMLSTPILNQPQSGILGMHAIKDRAVVVDGQIVIRPMMYLALSYDHRLVDGREAVTFLVKVKEVLEDPSRLLFGI